jgi:hypothetical protein
MKKTVIVLVCLLLLAAGVPLFARGHGGDHGRFSKDKSHRWQGSDSHPAFHGFRGWGQAPCRAPDGIPADKSSNPGGPKEDPGDKPGQTPGDKPGDKDGEQPMGAKQLRQLLLQLPLNPYTGSFPG